MPISKRFILSLLTLAHLLVMYILIILNKFKLILVSRVLCDGVLVVRLDAIGDYLLFRNFLKALKESNKYKDKKITLVGNKAWKEIAERYDSEIVDEFIWVDRKDFFNNFLYRFKILRKIASVKYEEVISPVYSRDFFYSDTIARFANAGIKIGSIGDFSNIKPWQKKISDKFYNCLITANPDISFEFYRNREFFENLLEKDLSCISFGFDKNSAKEICIIKAPYAVIFIGASNKVRKWKIDNFLEVSKYIDKNLGLKIVLCGVLDDLQSAGKFISEFDNDFINLVGETTLPQLVDVISGADLLVTNETAAHHIAACFARRNVFVIYNGLHYGRFVPYPKELAENCYVICHPEIAKNPEVYKEKSNTAGQGVYLDINEITADAVIQAIKETYKP